MNFRDKIKNFVMGSEEDDDFGEMADEGYDEREPVRSPASYDPIESYESYSSYESKKPAYQPERNKIVDFSSASKSSEKGQTRPHVVVAKLDKFEDVGDIAKSINENRMVIINLQEADNPTTQRIIDFIYGVSFANNSELKRIAFRTYIIKPHDYEFTGSDGFESSNMDGIIFGK